MTHATIQESPADPDGHVHGELAQAVLDGGAAAADMVEGLAYLWEAGELLKMAELIQEITADLEAPILDFLPRDFETAFPKGLAPIPGVKKACEGLLKIHSLIGDLIERATRTKPGPIFPDEINSIREILPTLAEVAEKHCKPDQLPELPPADLDHPDAYLPTPEEIRQERLAIQSTWDTDERLDRECAIPRVVTRRNPLQLVCRSCGRKYFVGENFRNCRRCRSNNAGRMRRKEKKTSSTTATSHVGLRHILEKRKLRQKVVTPETAPPKPQRRFEHDPQKVYRMIRKGRFREVTLILQAEFKTNPESLDEIVKGVYLRTTMAILNQEKCGQEQHARKTWLPAFQQAVEDATGIPLNDFIAPPETLTRKAVPK